MEAQFNAVFKAWDADKNGCLSRQEWNTMVQLSIRAAKRENVRQRKLAKDFNTLFRKLDVNHDGCISRSEYTSHQGPIDLDR
jgi:Ca2+-binding EF-hand superfamily protein